MLGEYIVQGERVVLPVGSDPAHMRIEGFLRYIVGLDLGSAIDPSGVAIIKDAQLPIWAPCGSRQILGKRTRTVVAVDQLRQHAYGEIAEYVRSLLMKPPIAGRWTLVIDASGVGRAFSATLDEAQIPHMAVQMTAGANAVRAGRFWNVGKSVLLSDLAGALENGTLGILRALPMRDLLLEELASFETKTTAEIGRAHV